MTPCAAFLQSSSEATVTCAANKFRWHQKRAPLRSSKSRPPQKKAPITTVFTSSEALKDRGRSWRTAPLLNNAEVLKKAYRPAERERDGRKKWIGEKREREGNMEKGERGALLLFGIFQQFSLFFIEHRFQCDTAPTNGWTGTETD